MHVKIATVDELFEMWDLSTGNESDIKSAIEEAFMKGALCGALDSDLAHEALDMFRNKMEMVRE